MRVYKMFKCSVCRRCPYNLDLVENINEDVIAERRRTCAVCEKRPPAEEIVGDLICHFFRTELKEDKVFKKNKNKIKDMLRHGYGQLKMSKELGLPLSQVQKYYHLYGMKKLVERERVAKDINNNEQ